MGNLSSKSSEILKTSHTSDSMPNEVHLAGLRTSKEYSQLQGTHSSTIKILRKGKEKVVVKIFHNKTVKLLKTVSPG